MCTRSCIKVLKKAFVALSALSLSFAISAAHASEWGYDDQAVGQSAKAESLGDSKDASIKKVNASGKRNAKVGSGKAKSSAATLTQSKKSKPDVPAVSTNMTVDNWLNLLGLVAPIPDSGQLPEGPRYLNQLTEDQRERFGNTLKNLIAQDKRGEFASINAYWKRLNERMKDVDQRGNYRLLFRALLSMRADAADVSDAEKEMIFEALGPKRIAEPGPPPLTEDAIHAYTDMACFLYDYSHPGKTVDADDNRELYGLMVRDKFKKAPSDKDRVAMNNFPLNWAKFRILYQDADEEKRKVMAERIASPEGLKGMNNRNEMLESVLSAPSWKRFVIGKSIAETGQNKKANTVE